MKLPTSALLSLAAFATQAAGVTIANFGVESPPACAGNYGVCRNIAQGVCCHGLNGGSFVRHNAALFTGGGSSGSAFICEPSGNAPCGGTRYYNKGLGNDCSVLKGGTFTGSFWRAPPPKERREEGVAGAAVAVEAQAVAANGSVLHDRAVIGGHMFRINYDVPARDSLALYELITSQAGYADVPNRLKKYEAVGETVPF